MQNSNVSFRGQFLTHPGLWNHGHLSTTAMMDGFTHLLKLGAIGERHGGKVHASYPCVILEVSPEKDAFVKTDLVKEIGKDWDKYIKYTPANGGIYH